ncbi:hypothetical protein OAI82_02935 [bacterium]|nr:hypothetical protein [bacterium]
MSKYKFSGFYSNISHIDVKMNDVFDYHYLYYINWTHYYDGANVHQYELLLIKRA